MRQQQVASMPPKRRLDSTENRTLHLSALARDERRLHKEANATEFYFGRMLAERMMSYAEVPQVQVSERVRDVIKAVPEGNRPFPRIIHYEFKWLQWHLCCLSIS